MKKTVMYTLALMVVMSTMQSCKKGDEDPGLSLRSRKARLTGEWVVSSYESKQYEDGVLDYSQILEGANLKGIDGDLVTFSQDFTFDKDGTYASTQIEDGITTTYKGNWAFLGKSKAAELKKKEAILLDETSSSNLTYNSTHSNFASGYAIAYELVKLSNKEVIMKYNIAYKDSDNINFSEESTITLTKK